MGERFWPFYSQSQGGTPTTHKGGQYPGCKMIVLQVNRARSWRWPCGSAHHYWLGCELAWVWTPNYVVLVLDRYDMQGRHRQGLRIGLKKATINMIFSVTLISFRMTLLMNKWTNFVVDDGWVHPQAKPLTFSCNTHSWLVKATGYGLIVGLIMSVESHSTKGVSAFLMWLPVRGVDWTLNKK